VVSTFYLVSTKKGTLEFNSTVQQIYCNNQTFCRRSNQKQHLADVHRLLPITVLNCKNMEHSSSSGLHVERHHTNVCNQMQNGDQALGYCFDVVDSVRAISTY
jgi:hypothetical protein